jgi:hypothetical protein
MVKQLFGKTAGPPKCSPNPMPQPAIIPLYPDRMLFSYIMGVLREGCQKIIPIICCYPVIAYPQPFYPLSQFFGSFQIPLSR